VLFTSTIEIAKFRRAQGWHAAAAFALLAVASAALPQSASADPPTDVVYVESNDPNGNAIFAFKRGADGSLTQLPGSPFDARGLGITPTFNLGPFDSDQEVIANPDHTLLFAVNGGSDSIAVFRINDDGSLTHVDGSPFPSRGSNPVSVGLAGNILCVVNKDQDPDHPGVILPNYTTLRVTEEGRLLPIPNSIVFTDAGASPSQALTVPAARLLFGADFMGGLLRSFQIHHNGRLMPVEAQPLPPSEFAGTGQNPFPLGLSVHPKRPLLYVGFVTINRMGVYQFTREGRLQFLRSVANSGQAICWVLVNRDGSRIYTTNTGDRSVSVYDSQTDATEPVEIQKVTLEGMANSFQPALDPTGQFLHVVTQRAAPTLPASANALHVLRVGGDGRLTEVPSSPTVLPVSPGTRPQGVVAF
jgi:6-phosphogluconolactonase (cycloisomerase 2 family)